MQVDTVLHNAKIYFRGRIVEAGIAVNNGRIFKIAKETNLPSASTKMNLKGQIALPGLIDLHVHLRSQQLAYKEDFFSGTAAAAAGGVALTIDMPNNKPVTMDPNSLGERMKLAEKQAVVNVGFCSAFPEKLEEVPSIVKEGAVAFKLYMSEKIGGLDIDIDRLLLQAFKEVSKIKVPVAVHAEDRRILAAKRREMEKAGHKDMQAYAKAHPPEAEAQAISRIVQLARKSRVQVHFCHMSSARGLHTFLQAKKAYGHLSCEVTPHHLLLSSEHFKRHGTLALANPPLRTKNDVVALWRGLRHGSIDAVASDHAPHTIEEKKASIWEAKPGIPGLETTLPLLLNELSKGRLPMDDLVKLTSEGPARIFNLRNRGGLEEGNWADIVVVDLDRAYKIDSTSFYSKAKYSPFDGWIVRGKPIKTLVNGHVVMDQGEVVAKPGTGHILGACTPQSET